MASESSLETKPNRASHSERGGGVSVEASNASWGAGCGLFVVSREGLALSRHIHTPTRGTKVRNPSSITYND